LKVRGNFGWFLWHWKFNMNSSYIKLCLLWLIESLYTRINIYIRVRTLVIKFDLLFLIIFISWIRIYVMSCFINSKHVIVNLTQLLWIMHNICKVLGLNSEEKKNCRYNITKSDLFNMDNEYIVLKKFDNVHTLSWQRKG